MSVPCSVPGNLLALQGGKLSLGGFDVGTVSGDLDASGRYEVSVPDELLERRTGSIDDGARFGYFVEYWLGAERVHRSEAALFAKGDDYRGIRYSYKDPRFAEPQHLVAEDGTIPIDYRDGQGFRLRPVAGLVVRRTEDDGPDEYVTAVEFYEPGREEHVHRSVYVRKKVIPSMAGEQGRMS